MRGVLASSSYDDKPPPPPMRYSSSESRAEDRVTVSRDVAGTAPPQQQQRLIGLKPLPREPEEKAKKSKAFSNPFSNKNKNKVSSNC